MMIQSPQLDVPVTLRGGSDSWDAASADIVIAEYFDVSGLALPFSIDWSGLWRANYTGVPWAGESTEGTSAGRSLAAGSAPSVGAAQNGYSPASFSGGSYLIASGAIEDYIGDGSPFEFAVVVKLDEGAYPDSTLVYDCPQIFGDTGGNIGLAVSDGGVRFWVYDSGGNPNETPVIPIAEWSKYHVLQGGWDGAKIWLTVDGASYGYASVRALSLFFGFRVGVNYDDTQFLDADILEIGTVANTLSASSRDAYLAYTRERYAIDRGCLVLLDGVLREMPRSAPYGMRVVLSSGALVTAVSSGKSIVIDSGILREVAAGESVRVPP